MSVQRISVEEEYKKNPDLLKSDIDAIRRWMSTQPHLPQNVLEQQLILFHHSCYFDIEQTKSCIEVYYTVRTNTPEFFSNRIITRPELQQALKVLQYGCFPTKTHEGYQVIFHRLQVYEASKYVFNDGVKLLSMAIDACLFTEGTVPGYAFLFDMRGVKLTHLTRLGLSSLRKFFLYLQEGMPVRLKEIHVINTRPLVDKIMALIKPFLKKDLVKLIHFHPEGEMDKIYQSIPKSCLPSDFGGDLPTCEKLHESYQEWMSKLTDFFESEENYKVNESKRLKKKSSEKYIEPEPDVSLKTFEMD